MIRGCVICQRAPAKKSVCCERKLCEAHELEHPCPRAEELAAIAADPKQVRQWKADNAPETAFTTQAIKALNHLPGVDCWRTKRARPAGGQSTEADGVLDISGFIAPDGLGLYVETKRDHKDECVCSHCTAQRDFAARATAAGCVVVLGVRTVQQAVDGVRMELARARARRAA